MTANNYIPEGYDRIKVVDDLCSFLTTDFDPIANVVLYPRRLAGDFDTLARKMAKFFNLGEEEIFIKYDDRAEIEEFRDSLSDPELIQAINLILMDMEFFQSAGVRTHMRLLTAYTEDERTHIFHVDGLEQDFDRYMTCYNNPVTQYIRNDDVIDVSGHDVIHREDAPVFEFRAGDIWKARVRNKPKNIVLEFLQKLLRSKESRAFVHRAQHSNSPRLILVGDLRYL